jgi:4-hydroxybenzoate polyprenyltransferase
MIAALIKAMRPHQWVKNLLVFPSLVFAHQLGDAGAVQRSVMAFGVFCLLSSSIYLLNDVVDLEADRAHPRKRNRPIASGALPVSVALLAAAVCATGSLIWAWMLSAEGEPKGLPFFVVPALYLLLQLCYSFLLKRILIIDCLCIALGFLLRVDAGSRVLEGVDSSSWLLLCTFFFALFVAFCKRRDEVVQVSDGSGSTRETMKRYTASFLDSVISSLASISILSYALYTQAEQTVATHNSNNLIITVPLVVYGVYRYQYLVQHRGEGGDPSRLLFRDRPLIVSGLVYAVTVWLALTINPLF